MLILFVQYEVVFPNEYVLDTDADVQLKMMAGVKDRRSKRHISRADASDATPLTGEKGESDFKTDMREEDDLHASGIDGYEEMLFNDARFLCQIPYVEASDLSDNSSDTSSVSHAKELARATSRGLELLNDLEDNCLYLLAGWWAYSFCYGKDVQQFHPLQPRLGVPVYPPQPDPSMLVYTLGRYPPLDEAQPFHRHRSEKSEKPNTRALARLESRGEAPYLVQQLGRGTKCSLTNKDRRVEVQFHCDPNTTDHIGYIKEITTCQYLMVIHTPRLCHDEAFLPPQRDDVHEIQCREIVDVKTVAAWETQEEAEEQKQIQAEESQKLDELGESTSKALPLVGTVRVGAKSIIKPDNQLLNQEKIEDIFKLNHGDGKKPESVNALASINRDGRDAAATLKRELEALGIPADQLKELRKRMEQLTPGREWRIETVNVENEGTSSRWMTDKPGGNDETEAKDQQKVQDNQNHHDDQHNQNNPNSNEKTTTQQRRNDMEHVNEDPGGEKKDKHGEETDDDDKARSQSKQKTRKKYAYKEEL